MSDLKANHNQAQKRVQDLEGSVQDLRSKVDKADDQNRKQEAEAHKLRHQAQASSTEVNTCKQQIQALEASLHDARERHLIASTDAGTREQDLETELRELNERSREEVLPAPRRLHSACTFRRGVVDKMHRLHARGTRSQRAASTSAAMHEQVRRANERAGEARAALAAAQEEAEALRHAAAQQEELLAQVAALRGALAEAQADSAAREDELAASRTTLERKARLPCCAQCACACIVPVIAQCACVRSVAVLARHPRVHGAFPPSMPLSSL